MPFVERTRLSRQESRERTRAKLLESAERLFRSRGFHATSVEEIAESAGFSRGAVYSNFESKEDMFLALMDRWRATVLDVLVSALTPSPETGALDDLSTAIFFSEKEIREADWQLAVAEFFVHALRSEPLRRELAAAYMDEREKIAAALENKLPEAAPRVGMTTAELASVIAALDTGLGLRRWVDPDSVPPDLFARTVSALVEDRTQR